MVILEHSRVRVLTTLTLDADNGALLRCGACYWTRNRYGVAPPRQVCMATAPSEQQTSKNGVGSKLC